MQRKGRGIQGGEVKANPVQLQACRSGIGEGEHLPKGNQVNPGELTRNPTLLISLALFQSLQTVVGFNKIVFEIAVCLLVCFFVWLVD